MPLSLLCLCIMYLYVSQVGTAHVRKIRSVMAEAKEFNTLITFTDKSTVAQMPFVILRKIMEFLPMNTKPTSVSRASRMAAFESISDEQWSNIMTNYFDASFLIKFAMENWILSAWNYFDDEQKYRISRTTRQTHKYPDGSQIQVILDDIYFPFDERVVERTSLILCHTSPDWMRRVISNTISLSLFNESVAVTHLHESYVDRFDIKELIGCLDEVKRFCMHYSDTDTFQNILESMHSDLSWQWHDLMENENRRDPAEWLTPESMERLSVFWISWLKYTNFGWRRVTDDTKEILSILWALWNRPEPIRLSLVFQHHQYLDGEVDTMYKNITYLSKFNI